MKFVDDFVIRSRLIETEDGTQYRCNMSGDSWERLYGESWESVYGTEESELIAEFTRYFYKKNGECLL